MADIKKNPVAGCTPATGQNKQHQNEYHITDDFLCELEALTIKHSGLGCYPDLAHMSVAEAYGLYLFLSRQ